MGKHQEFTFQYFIPHRSFNLHILPFYYIHILRIFAILKFYGFFNNLVNAAETLGFIKGLTDIVQRQVDSMKSADTQIQQLTSTVENLAKTQPTPSKPTTVNSGLKLPKLVLPEFTGI